MLTKRFYIPILLLNYCQIHVLDSYADTSKIDYLADTLETVQESMTSEVQGEIVEIENQKELYAPIDENIEDSILYVPWYETELSLHSSESSSTTVCNVQNNEISNDPNEVMYHLSSLIQYWSMQCNTTDTVYSSSTLSDSDSAEKLQQVLIYAESQIALGKGMDVVQELLDNIIYLDPFLIDDYLCTLHAASKQYLEQIDPQSEPNSVIPQVSELLTEALHKSTASRVDKIDNPIATYTSYYTGSPQTPTVTSSSTSSIGLNNGIREAQAFLNRREYAQAVERLRDISLSDRFSNITAYDAALLNALTLFLQHETGPQIPQNATNADLVRIWTDYLNRWDNYARLYRERSGRNDLPSGVRRPQPPSSIRLDSPQTPRYRFPLLQLPVIPPTTRQVPNPLPQETPNRRPCPNGYTQTEYFCMHRQNSNQLPSTSDLAAELDAAVPSQNSRFSEGMMPFSVIYQLNRICGVNRCFVQVNAANRSCGGETIHQFGYDGYIASPSRMNFRLALDCGSTVTWQSIIRHEVSHLVSVHYIRGPIPRWADEGLAVLAEIQQVITEHWNNFSRDQHFASRYFNIILFLLIRLENYPLYTSALYDSGTVLTQFFIDNGARHPADNRRGLPRFIGFLNRFHQLRLEGNGRAWLPAYSQSLLEYYPAYFGTGNQTQVVGIPSHIILGEFDPADRNTFLSVATINPTNSNQLLFAIPSRIVELYRQFRAYYYARANRVAPPL